jgi:pyridoxal phosphate enzyme (YggS family)
MPIRTTQYHRLVEELKGRATLVAVSKTKPSDDIQTLYELGQRDFGENYVQELIEKQAVLPADIRWHFIGHLQKNKVKLVAPFVYLVHGVDSESLLKEINKQGIKNNRVVHCLLQVHIAKEETKFGLNAEELAALMQLVQDNNTFTHILIRGLMGMASFTEDTSQVKTEFAFLHDLYEKFKTHQSSNIRFSTLSMGMSGDYKIALDEGGNLVRIGSLLFGERE